jgi:hypothetical protein
MAIKHADVAADDYGYPQPNTGEVHGERQTSVTAHVVRSIAVTMSMIEMDTLVHSLGRMRDELTDSERTVQDEFVAAVETARF